MLKGRVHSEKWKRIDGTKRAVPCNPHAVWAIA
jgi:hypothetical protein